MIRTPAGLAAVLGLALTASARAAPPQITGTVPFGVRKGVATEVTIQGANLSGTPQWIAPFGFTTAPDPAPNGDAAHRTLRLTVDPDVPLGVYPIRVRTEDGLSNPFLFSVGQLPRVAEVEDNSTFEKAQAIAVPAVVEGQSAGNDVDFFRFSGKKGRRIVVDAQCARIGSGVDPTLRLTTADGTYVASAEDTPGLLTDARLTAVLPDDTDYVVELSDSQYQGDGRPVYRLLVGSVPVAAEVFPLGGRRGETVGLEFRGGTLPDRCIAAATLNPAPGADVVRVHATNQVPGPARPGEPVLEIEALPPLDVGDLPELREPADPDAPTLRVAVPVVLNGRIDPAGDEDRFVLAVTPGQRLHVRVDARRHGSALDGVLQVLGARGSVLAEADDTITPVKGKDKKVSRLVNPDPALDITVPDGLTEVTLALRDLEARGGTGFPYRITVAPATPSFDVVLADPEVNVPRGGTAAVGVTVIRKGYGGPIALRVVNPPVGLTVRPGVIAEGQEVGAFTLSAAVDAAFGAVHLDVIGQGEGPDGPIVAAASVPIVFAQQGSRPTNTITQTGLACAPALPRPVTLDAPAMPIEVAQGFGGLIPIRVVRSPGADAALTIVSLPLPPGLTVPTATLAENATEGQAAVNAAVEVPLGPMTVALVAQGKIGNTEATFALPAVTLDVVRPAALELAAPVLVVDPGATVELSGKVTRRGTFQGPVTLTLDGLPAGLQADPVAVAPDRSDFRLKVIAEPKAPAASAVARVLMTFQVDQKEYPMPPTPLSIEVRSAP